MRASPNAPPPNGEALPTGFDAPNAPPGEVAAGVPNAPVVVPTAAGVPNAPPADDAGIPFPKGLAPAPPPEGDAADPPPKPKLPNPAATPPVVAVAAPKGDALAELAAAPNADGVAIAVAADAPNPPNPVVFAGVANAVVLPNAPVTAAGAPNGDAVAETPAGAPNGDVTVEAAAFGEAPPPPPTLSKSSCSDACACAYPVLAFARNALLNPPVFGTGAVGFAAGGVDGASGTATGDAGGETGVAAAGNDTANAAADEAARDAAGDEAAGCEAASNKAAGAVAGDTAADAVAAKEDENVNVDVDSAAPNAGTEDVVVAEGVVVDAAVVDVVELAVVPAATPNAELLVVTGSVNPGDASAPPNENVVALVGAAPNAGAEDAGGGFAALSRSS